MARDAINRFFKTLKTIFGASVNKKKAGIV
jgi:hypothetical protein